MLVRIHCDLKPVSNVLEGYLFLYDCFTMHSNWRLSFMDDVYSQRPKYRELCMILMHISTVAVQTQVEVLADLAHEPVGLDRLHLAVGA